ncbi:MAG TPA: phosphoribosyltransferase family protein, partial [Candidatus Nanoarchaeia archaeon]
SETGWQIACEMAELVFCVEFDTIAGPTHVGDKIAYDLGLALLLNKGRNVGRFYAQESAEEGTRSFPRQTGSVAGMRVLVVDDVLTTGGTIDETIEAVRKDGGTPVAVAVVCNRSEFRGEFKGFPLLELMYVPFEAWKPEQCQACVERVPVYTEVGHGKDFLKEYGEDPAGWPANRK